MLVNDLKRTMFSLQASGIQVEFHELLGIVLESADEIRNMSGFPDETWFIDKLAEEDLPKLDLPKIAKKEPKTLSPVILAEPKRL
ncbi:MAG TPA: hypothetical protein PKA63_12060 [Oligoflexia bacterium]|nr:hypothetical protein [Oligoflexia bacterium]HMP49389.1 hypothetical protein [Oligoflexia bacterium]